MMKKNYQMWKDIYEAEYQMPLYYTTVSDTDK